MCSKRGISFETTSYWHSLASPSMGRPSMWSVLACTDRCILRVADWVAQLVWWVVHVGVVTAASSLDGELRHALQASRFPPSGRTGWFLALLLGNAAAFAWVRASDPGFLKARPAATAGSDPEQDRRCSTCGADTSCPKTKHCILVSEVLADQSKCRAPGTQLVTH